ncbi:MAG: S-ribosylhomocysteine lyase [Victivallaceae bacterium]|nr:S-ribosylhomocysteine lyase [Victivallaceae bacterium]
MESRSSISFDVDHLRMTRGIYIPAVDRIESVVVTTFDIRVRRPYAEPVMTEGEAHTVEHMLATGLRSQKSDRLIVLYFGPMGCMTGFYLLLAGEASNSEKADFIAAGAEAALAMEEVPARNARQCGNYGSLLDVQAVRPILEEIRDMARSISGRGAFDAYPSK